MTTKGSNNPFPHILMVEGDKDAVTPLPSVGSQRLVVDDTDHLLYLVDDAGVATLVGGGGSSDLDAIIAASSGQDIADALSGADAPGAGNVFATIADIGGGGAPSTAEYLTTAADAGLSAERVIDLGAYSLLTRRASANTEDDHFNASSLDAKWLAYTGLNPTTSLTALLGWCQITSGGYKLQAVPAGDWTIETEVILGDTTAASYQDAGLILTNGTTLGSATDARFGIGHNNSLLGYRIIFEKFVNGTFNSTYQDNSLGGTGGGAGVGNGAPWPTDYLFMRVNKTSTTYVVEVSTTGRSWQRLASTSSLGFTPTHFGLGGSSGSFFNYFLRY